MTDQLESDLREALAARAEQLPSDVSARVRARDYRPRTRSLRPPVAAGALLTAAAATAAVLLIDLGPRAPTAFAGWSPKPTAAGADQISSAEAGCRQQLSSGAAAAVRHQFPHALPPSMLGLPVVLTDVRGPFTFVVLADAQRSATCISGPQFTSVAGSASSQPAAPLPAGQIAVTQLAHTSRAGNAYSFAEGRTGSGVTAATLNLSDGSHVQATVQNGWFVAWWPSGAGVSSAAVTAGAGTNTQTLNTPAAAPCPPGATCGSASGGGTGQAFGETRMTGTGS
ncbi:MAG TPA: hypothetical protein VHX62_18110 [Solirubrobacteraceae bacterium]|jgi:hypothetical protein|nr:hypothetical protein [Solirubrobacteraceae bacterium]